MYFVISHFSWQNPHQFCSGYRMYHIFVFDDQVIQIWKMVDPTVKK